MIKNISVIGLGKLGGSMAASFASKGFNVIGVDINQAVVDDINNGKAPIQETGLDDLIKANKPRLRATVDTKDAIMNSDISFVIVPTPSDQRGAFSLHFAKHAFKELGNALKKKKQYHVIVMTSTVLPGACRYGLLPIIERESGKVCGKDFGFCYNPEFIALGTVIRDFLNPDFYLLGQFDKKSGDLLEMVHNAVSMNNAPVKRLSLENAELAKISVNSFVTLKISFANMLSEFCEKIPGGNVDEVSEALGMDKRIGRKYLNGGLGFAGPCFPRDNVALEFFGKELGVDSRLLNTNHKYNRSLSLRHFQDIKKKIPPNAQITILGLAYKPMSHITEESPGLNLAKIFSDNGYRVVAHDPLATFEAKSILGQKVIITESLDEALADSEVIIVTTTDKEYLKLKASQIIKKKNKVIFIDFWRKFKNFENEPDINYIAAGMSNNNETFREKLVSLWNDFL